MIEHATPFATMPAKSIQSATNAHTMNPSTLTIIVPSAKVVDEDRMNTGDSNCSDRWVSMTSVTVASRPHRRLLACVEYTRATSGCTRRELKVQ